jgi:hypothetical protein
LADRARQTTRGDGVLVEAMEARAQGSLEEARAQCRATASRKSLAQLERRRLESLVDRQSMPS